jgi:hypothetical protein
MNPNQIASALIEDEREMFRRLALIGITNRVPAKAFFRQREYPDDPDTPGEVEFNAVAFLQRATPIQLVGLELNRIKNGIRNWRIEAEVQPTLMTDLVKWVGYSNGVETTIAIRYFEHLLWFVDINGKFAMRWLQGKRPDVYKKIKDYVAR